MISTLNVIDIPDIFFVQKNHFYPDMDTPIHSVEQ
jgi:hypothetical protein